MNVVIVTFPDARVLGLGEGLVLTNEQKVSVVKTYLASFETRDIATIADLYADDASMEDPVGTDPKVGKDVIAAFYKSALPPGIKTRLLGKPHCAGDSVAFVFEARVHNETDNTVMTAIDTFRFNPAGKIMQMRAFWGPDDIVPATLAS